jgi:hypothetical protein
VFTFRSVSARSALLSSFFLCRSRSEPVVSACIELRVPGSLWRPIASPRPAFDHDPRVKVSAPLFRDPRRSLEHPDFLSTQRRPSLFSMDPRGLWSSPLSSRDPRDLWSSHFLPSRDPRGLWSSQLLRRFLSWICGAVKLSSSQICRIAAHLSRVRSYAAIF